MIFELENWNINIVQAGWVFGFNAPRGVKKANKENQYKTTQRRFHLNDDKLNNEMNMYNLSTRTN